MEEKIDNVLTDLGIAVFQKKKISKEMPVKFFNLGNNCIQTGLENS